jgi:hypothetical protein
MTKRLTDEEKAAKQIAKIVNDLTLDIELVGEYLANQERNVSYNRLIVVAESAQYQKEMKDVRNNLDPLF